MIECKRIETSIDDQKHKNGFTLVETIFSMVILAVVFFGVFAVVQAANTIFSMNSVYAEHNQGAMQVLRSIAREVGQSSPLVTPNHFDITEDDDDNSIIVFQIPVDYDDDGDVVNSDLDADVEWGAYSVASQNEDGLLDHWVRYRVVEEQLLREILDEDLNLVEDSERVIANNVESFTVEQNQEIVTMELGLSKEDERGQMSSGGEGRVLTSTFSTNVAMRNAVN